MIVERSGTMLIELQQEASMTPQVPAPVLERPKPPFRRVVVFTGKP